MSLQRNAQSLVSAQILSRFSLASAYNRESGLPYYRFVKDQLENFDSNFEKLTAELDSVLKLLANRDGILIHATADKSTLDEFEKNLPMLTNSLPNEKRGSYGLFSF